MRLGIVDLDTSHPGSWIPLERRWGCEIVGVYDGGAVRSRRYVEQFAERLAIPRIYERIEELADDVEGVIIHGCDWDTHIDKARVFVERGRSVLIDKPMAGNVRDMMQLRRWAEEGARITGGSSLRFCEEVTEYLDKPVEERGSPHTVVCSCGVDEFNYGIHAYSLACGIMGPGVESVRHLGRMQGRTRVQLNWADGRAAIVVIGKPEWLAFAATIITECGSTQMEIDHTRLYEALLEKCLPYMAGRTEKPPVTMEQLIEAELAAVAAKKSWENDDATVKLAELNESDAGYDGGEFAAEYRRQRAMENPR